MIEFQKKSKHVAVYCAIEYCKRSYG